MQKTTDIEFSGFDTWINNLEITASEVLRMFDIHFWGFAYGTQTALSHYNRSGKKGSIINVGCGLLIYATTKTKAQKSLKSDSLRVECFSDFDS